ncbi:hypothetical protein [Streptosporangium sp. NPDC000396]|uniref:hypothetical protein n=1 Tax=Streptosporangium sp. NPDC000396 TaxID=3366185 RepID=UPI0036C244DE
MIVLSLVAAALAFFLVPTSYVSTASMVLTTPATGGTLSTDPTRPIGLTNPLLQFSDGLRVTAGILILSMNTPEVAAELGVVENGPTQLTINDGRTNPDLLGISTNGPFIYVEVRSRSAAAAQDVVLRAKQRIRDELGKRQQALRAPRSTFISIVDVVPSSTPEAKMSGKLMAAGGAMFLVLFVGFGIAYGVTQYGRAGGGPSHPRPARKGWAGEPDHGGAVADEPVMTVYPAVETREPDEGPFQDEPVQLVVVVDDEEERFAHHDEQGADTIVFMRAGGRDDHEK